MTCAPRSPSASTSILSGWARGGAVGGVCSARRFRQDEHAMSASTSRSAAELTQAVLGRAMTFEDAWALLAPDEWARTCNSENDELGARIAALRDAVWVGSAGYERYKNSGDFAQKLADAGVERVIDVRELPISRRRGYAKTALAEAMGAAGVEYVHVKALGNPRPFRDLYKSGRVDEGRAAYDAFLLAERREALETLAAMLLEKPSALMCFEDDPATCHRTVILNALCDELGLPIEVDAVA
jgi:hypothetical protein